MTWVKLDDTFPDHPKVLTVGDAAAWLYVCGLCYCSKHLTDGFIPRSALERLTGQPKAPTLASRLVEADMWAVVDGGWRVHNYEKRQRTREQIEAERISARVRANHRRSSRAGSAEPTEPEEKRPPYPPEGEPKSCVVCEGKGWTLNEDENTAQPCAECNPRWVGEGA